jgi:hypothetical protein
MNSNPKGARRHPKGRSLWTRSRALAALPYVRPVVRSLREHALEVQRHRLTARRLAAQPGRPGRATLIAHQEAVEEARKAAARFEEVLEELEALQIACADAVNGQALFPFMHGKKPAWLVFNLFEGEPLRHWRYQEDEPDVRRPVSALEEAAGEGKHLA